jgi:hypothetical protein
MHCTFGSDSAALEIWLSFLQRKGVSNENTHRVRVSEPYNILFVAKDENEIRKVIFFYMALQLNAGYGFLIHEVLKITHTTCHNW